MADDDDDDSNEEQRAKEQCMLCLSIGQVTGSRTADNPLKTQQLVLIAAGRVPLLVILQGHQLRAG